MLGLNVLKIRISTVIYRFQNFSLLQIRPLKITLRQHENNYFFVQTKTFTIDISKT